MEKITLQCQYCLTVFTRKKLLHGEIRCPKCREYDVSEFDFRFVAPRTSACQVDDDSNS